MLSKRCRVLLTGPVVASLVSVNSFAADASTTPVMGMAKKLAEAKQFSVTINMNYDAVQKSGQKIEFSEMRKITLSRPNHLRVDAQQSDGDRSRLIFDGKVLTLFSAAENVYSQTSHPGDVDAAVHYAVGKLGMRVPLARMLLTSFPEELQKLSKKVDYVERNTLGATPTDHITGQLKDVDYQLWIDKDKLPTRIVLTYKHAPGQPQFRADFSGWNLAPKISDATFSFTPPKGAEKIPTLLPAAQSEVIGKTKGGAE